MPISVPTMLLLNRVRQLTNPYQKAKSLSNVWYYRLYGYGLFGGLVILSGDYKDSLNYGEMPFYNGLGDGKFLLTGD